ncbi:MAG TPA: DUF1844 domain-containing protein [Nitrospiria bacterium]|nr:DUF1844 domain-containing protein [Nitrospiria bacterium]
MSEEEKEEIKVQDKRRFSAETGELRKDVPPAAEEKKTAPPPKTEKQETPKVKPGHETHQPPPPESIFPGFLLGIAAQAMALMGAVPESKEQQNLPAAKHLIDILEVLQTKTKGNLEKGEEQLLTNTLYELRMMFVEATKKK